MGLENLKNLSPKLFNDRIKKFDNKLQHAPDGKRVLQPGIQHQSEHTTLDDLQYQESVFGRTFKPFFNRVGSTLYTPDLPGWPVLFDMENTNLGEIYFNPANKFPTFQRVDSEIGEDKYGVGVRDSQSPMSNTEDSSKSDDPILDGAPDIDGSYLLNNYSRNGTISIEHKPFVSTTGNHNYNSLKYGFNSYKGSLLDDGIGGTFNSSINYSLVFREIYTPQGYGESPIGNDILGRGNYGQGYLDRLDLLNEYKNTRETGKPPSYIDSTSTEEGSINLSSFYYYGGQPTNYIPFLNRYVDSSTDGKGNRVFGGSEPTEKRKVPLNYDITGQTLRSMDQHTLLFGDTFQQRVNTDNKKIEVVGQKLSLQDAAYNSGFRQSIFKAPNGSSGFLGEDFTKFLGGNNTTGGEPYMIYSNSDYDLDMITYGRDLPWNQTKRDAGRFIKFITSQAGALFVGKQNLLGLTARPNPQWTSNVFNSPPGPMRKAEKKFISKLGSMIPLPQKYRPFYNPVSTLAQIITNGAVGYGGSSIAHIPRDFPFFPDANEKFWISNQGYTDYMKNDGQINMWEDGLFYRNQLSNRKANEKIGVDINNSVRTSIDPTTEKPGPFKGFGDFMTLIELNKASKNIKTLSDAHPNDGKHIESSKSGMPFYFYDMRTNQYLIFRGYIEGLTENVAPQWNSDRYVGRSEPVYSYVGAERDISFSLKFFAHTRFELNSIYVKLNKLTSMCYPQYKLDNNFSGTLTRMKPPLVKMRLGELYGNSTGNVDPEGGKISIENKDLMGFIKSISYTVPDESPWEIARGKRVPKYITSAMTFQVIHDEVPNMNTQFFGFSGYSKSDKTPGYYKEDGSLESPPYIGEW